MYTPPKIYKTQANLTIFAYIPYLLLRGFKLYASFGGYTQYYNGHQNNIFYRPVLKHSRKAKENDKNSILLYLQYFMGLFSVIRSFRYYAPINGLPQDGGFRQPRGIRLRKAHVGWDFDSQNDPWGGTFDLAAILKSREDLGMSDEWCTVLKHTQNSCKQVFRVQEYSTLYGVLCCFF